MQFENVEDIYPLSPMQEGILFQEVSAPGSGEYFRQAVRWLAGDLDLPALERAWREVIDRHSILRTAFVWDEGEEPVQVVCRQVELPIARHDWRADPPAEQERRLEGFLEADRRRGFVLTDAPLMRLSLFRTADDAFLLVWSFHHLLLDGWSVALAMDRALACYQALREGRPLPAMPNRPYRDYIAWLRSQDLGRAEAFWRRQLAGFTVPTPLPFAGRTNGHGGGRRESRSLRLAEPLRGALEELGRRHRLTVNTLMQGAWGLLLGRYTGEPDVVFGATTSGRPTDLPGFESMVGLFINTLPVRVRLEAATPLLSWLEALQREQADARQLEYSPLVRVQAWSEVPRGQALFETLLVFENYRVEGEAAAGDGGIEQKASRFLDGTTFPLTLVVKPGPPFVLRLIYDSERFDAATAARAVGHLEVFLAGLVADPGRRLGEVALTSAAERHQLVVEWNDTAADFPAEAGLHHLVARQARARPGAPALVFGEERMTYAELERSATETADRLRRLGVGRGDRVGLFLERSADLVVAMLGVLAAGGAYVPLDPGYPAERLAFMIEDSGAAAIVTRTSLAAELPEASVPGRPRLCLDAPEARTAGAAGDADEGGAWVEVGGSDLAYVTYTSGSTGRPKGVAVPHRAVARLVCNADYVRLRPEDRIAQASNASFDAATFEVWGALVHGACLVGVSQDLLLAPRELARHLEVEAIDVLFLTTALFDRVVAEAPSAFAGLRHLLFGGQAVDPRPVRTVAETAPPERLLHVYGPTETTTFASWQRVSAVEPGATTVAIGLPIANTALHLLDRALQPVPVGVIGELFVGGAGLARGYHGEPRLTAERFVPDPLAGPPGSRLYRTGDLVRRRPEGAIEYVGRIDHQVKVRGFRVELGEIEAALLRHPAVAAAAIVVREEVPGDRRLIAYVVPAAGEPPAPGELRAFLRRSLPDYMLPALFVPLAALPLTANGKVDLRALPDPGDERPDLGCAAVAPRSAAEASLAAIWAEVLRVDRVGVEDNFFELGGDSILCLQIVSRAQREGLRISARQVFEHQTVAELAALAGRAEESTAEQGLVTGPVPLTPIQRWFFSLDLPERHHFNQTVLLELRRALPRAAVAAAVARLVEHHDALRLRFRPAAVGWEQENAGAEAPAPFLAVDLAALPGAVGRRAIETVCAQAQASLDLGDGPLLRVVHLFLGDDAAPRLLVAVHHLVVDGVSWRVLLEDMAAAALQAEAGEPVRLAPKTTSWRAWAERLAAFARGSELAAELPFWAGMGAATSPLPVEAPDGANLRASVVDLTVELGSEETDALLHRVPGAYRTQINDALLAALALVLCRWSGGAAVLVDLEGHGREEIGPGLDLSRTVGWFTSIFPVRLEVDVAGGPVAALKAVKEHLRSIPRRGVGFGLLRHLGEADAADRLGRLAQAEVSFNYLGQADQALSDSSPFVPAAESAGPSSARSGSRSYLLEINSMVVGGRLQVRWTWSSRLHRQATIEALANDYLARLRSLIACCLAAGAGGHTPSDFPLARLDQATLDRCLAGRHDVEDLYPLSPSQEGLLFHALYEREAGAYFLQLRCTLVGDLDPEPFLAAWREVVQRHPVLRTSFLWDGLERPLQVVHRRATLPVTAEDWRGVDEGARRLRLESYLARDRERGLDLASAPLMRLALFRLDDRAFQLVWSYHHILLDGWCLALLVREIFALYEAGRRGERPDLPATRPYRDYIAWLETLDLAAAEAYWRGTLAGFSSPTPVPGGRGEVGALGGAGSPDEQERRLAPAVAAELEALARRHRLTLNTLVQAAWGLLLGRYGGEADVVFGVTVAGRPAELAGAESMIGLFVNSLPVRVRLADERALLPWLAELQAEQVELRQHEQTPLASIQGWSEVDRGSPLFETLYAFENYPVTGALSEAGSERGFLVEGGRLVDRTTYTIDVIVLPRDGLLLRLRYDRRRFDGTTMRRMVGHWAHLLEEMAAAPRRHLGSLALLAAAETHQLLHEWNDSAAELPLDRPFPALFARQAERRPEAIAAAEDGSFLSYAELARRASRLAARLGEAGLRPGHVVALLSPRGLDLLVALLATLEARGVYLPLDPQQPAGRLADLLRRAEAGLALVAAGSRPALELALGGIEGPARAEVIELGEEAEEGRGSAGRPAGRPGAPPGGAEVDDLAYVIYTSGSTGAPKGAMVVQRGMVNHLLAKVSALGLGTGDQVAQTASQSFDISVWQLLAPLAAGGAVRIYGDPVAHDPEQLLDRLERDRITVVETVPSLLRVLLDQVEARGAGQPRLPALRWMIPTGEALPPDLAGRWQALYPHVPLLNAYGPTECSDDVTHGLVERPLRAAAARVPIGRPVVNTWLWVLDAGLRPLPIGVPGELWVGGAGVGRGYLADPRRTAEVFAADPFGETPGGRAYRTGDLVQRLSDGSLDFLGRVDHQVKVRGFRIEPGEIESVLVEHPAVEQSVVVVREDAPGATRLVAYVVADRDRALGRTTEAASAGDAGGSPAEGVAPGPDPASGLDEVGQWQAVYDEVYAQDSSRSQRDPGVNLRVWVSSFTGESLPEDEIFECFEDSVARIRALRPRRLLEIGCGTGLLLLRIAPHTEAYWGTDLSPRAVAALGERVSAAGEGLAGVRLLARRAEELADLPAGFFDTVVINEVVHYFPTVDYLVQVLAGVVPLLGPGGRIFLGGLRNLHLLRAFHADVQLFRAPGDLPVDELRQRAREATEREKELLLDPALFDALRRHLPIRRVEMELKGGRARNEITRFRFDAVLTLGEPEAEVAPAPGLDWVEDGLSLAGLRARLEAERPDRLILQKVPDARSLPSVEALRLLDEESAEWPAAGDLRHEVERRVVAAGAMEPSALWELGAELGYATHVFWSARGARPSFDVLFHRSGAVGEVAWPPPIAAAEPRPWSRYGNDPLRRHVAARLLPWLRDFVAERLPEYMVPAAFVLLDALPLTPNGKVDRRALPAPGTHRPELRTAIVPPRTSAELRLAAIWRDVLSLEEVGINDSFFALGGDSILSLQIVSRALRAGLSLTPRQVFEHPTIAGLAAVARDDAGVAAVTGDGARLYPVSRFQRLLLDAGGAAEARVATLAPRPGEAATTLERALTELVRRHEALRLRFERAADGWRQHVATRQMARPPASIDLSALPAASRRQAAAALEAELAGPVSLAPGSASAVLRLRLGDDGERFLLAVHAAAVDRTSWGRLLADLDLLRWEAGVARASSLPPAASLGPWLERLAGSGYADGWTVDPPLDGAIPAEPGAVAEIPSAQRLAVELPSPAARRLQEGTDAAFQARVEEVALAALALALSRRSGESSIAVEVVSDQLARRGLPEEASGAVGCFTVAIPLRVEVDRDGAPGRTLLRVREAGRRAAAAGVRETALDGRDEPAPPKDQPVNDRPGVRFRFLPALPGPVLAAGDADEVAPAALGTPALEIAFRAAGGDLQVSFSGRAARDAAAVEAMANELRRELERLIERHLTPIAGGYTPVDFPLADVDAPALARVVDGAGEVEDLYPLAPLQEGMLFHHLLAPQAHEYFVQLTCVLTGDLDRAAFIAAWRRAVQRHPALRSSFVWDELERPLQRVHREAVLPVVEEDWRPLGVEEQRRRLDGLLARDREEGFELGHPPMLRLSLLATADATHRLVWSHHHIVLDGWSFGLLVRDVFVLYRSALRGEEAELAPAQPYRDFIAWLAEQDAGAAELHWRKALAGFAEPTPLPTDRLVAAAGRAGLDHTLRQRRLSADVTRRLETLARDQQLTFNTLVQGAWGLLLARGGGTDEVVFGTTVAGRPPGLPGVESMVGLFINTLPTRLAVDEASELGSWLAQLQGQQLDQRRFEHTPLADIQGWSDVPRGLPLFESILSFENFPVDAALRQRSGGDEPFAVSEAEVSGRTNFALTAVAIPGEEGLLLRISYDAQRFDATTVSRLLERWERLLAGMELGTAQRLGELPLLSPSERHQLTMEERGTWDGELSGATLHQLFARQAESAPDRVAISLGDEVLTYGELELRAGRLAHRLLDRGVGSEVRVGLLAERSIEMVVGILGILAAGAAYVPLDPAYPAERLSFLLEDALAGVEVPLVVCQEALVGQLPVTAAELLRIDADEALGDGATRPHVAVEVSAAQAAYVIYTSGSTGRPKGVVVPHGAVVRLFTSTARRFDFRATDVWTLFHSYAFDFSVWELWGALLHGGRVVVVPHAISRSPAELLFVLAEQRVTVLSQTPSAFRQLLWAEAETESPEDRLAALRLVVFGGEALAVDSLAAWWRLHGSRVELVNMYGITETTVHVTHHRLSPAAGEGSPVSPIGRALPDLELYVVDRRLQPAPFGVQGEAVIGGAGVARGYLGRPGLTAERFVPDPFGARPGARLYRSGDRVRRLADGGLEYLGRLDQQVKIRGFRIELGEIEATLALCAGVRQSLVTVREDQPGDRRLVAYVVADGSEPAPVETLRRLARERLPAHMVPSAFVPLASIPLTAHGKVDRRALPAPEESGGRVSQPPRGSVERAIASVWREVLHVGEVGVEDNFFDLGGHSLHMVQVQSHLRRLLDPGISMVDLFRYPTVAALAQHLSPRPALSALDAGAAAAPAARSGSGASEVAVIGLGLRFPGANNPAEFWRNLRDGVESITFFSDAELAAAGVPARVIDDPRYVKARGILEDIEWFDAAFFGFSPREAELLDPQHRLFLEVAWEAMESAGYDPGSFTRPVGVFSGVGMSTYLLNLFSNRQLVDTVGELQIRLGNDRDFLPTRVSYKLNLKGPSIDVQTACSTSLVAVHLACRSLIQGECDFALAGGSTIDARQRRGYIYQEDGIVSPDGHCRSFDALAQGSVGGNGAGVVLLKRLADALADRDPIHAVIRGSAVTNDGAARIGFTAPGVEGQARAIREAQRAAGVAPETISYVEAHGSATALGDPIEVAALSEAFGAQSGRRGFCALGSVKSNVGHLDTASGVAGLIKTVLALENRALPPSLHFEQPNPQIDFAASPFYVNDHLREWSTDSAPRRAGVSSFGLGGTNAHVVVEEAPAPVASGESRPVQLLLLSARSETALEAATDRLAQHLGTHPEQQLADVAFTLQVGRRPFAHRRMLVVGDGAEGARRLAERSSGHLLTHREERRDRPVAFLLPGVGDHYPQMARGLYVAEPTFRRHLDHCCDLLVPSLGRDLRELLFPRDGSGAERDSAGEGGLDLRRLLHRESGGAPAEASPLDRTSVAQPAVFAIEYALARLWMDWGVQPEAMLGYSVGELTAACLAGVFSLEEALPLVAERARLIESLPAGAMLAVPFDERAVAPWLGDSLSIAALNGPELSVVSGSVEAVDELEQRLKAADLACVRLQTHHAFHSHLMQPVAAALAERVSRLRLSSPRIPYLSNVTGTWVRPEEALDPDYWARHLCQPVRFSDGLAALLEEPDRVLLEVGPGQALSTAARQHPARKPGQQVVASLRDARDATADEAFLLGAVGRLWLAGARVDWDRFSAHERRRRVELPTYPFERQRYWVEQGQNLPFEAHAPAARRADVADWFYLPHWKPAEHASAPALDGLAGRWLVLSRLAPWEVELVAGLRRAGAEVVVVAPGDGAFERRLDGSYCLDPRDAGAYSALLAELAATGGSPIRALHLWCSGPSDGEGSVREAGEAELDRGFFSLLFLAQAMGRGSGVEISEISVVTSGMQAVAGEGGLLPERAAILGPVRVLPAEYERLRCRSIDLAFPAGEGAGEGAEDLVAVLLEELAELPAETTVAYRRGQRLVQAFEPVRLEGEGQRGPRLRERGCYLITGGLGGIGLELAADMARRTAARLVLTGRSPFPPREAWGPWLGEHGEDDAVSRRIRRIEEIEACGGEVLALDADVADRERMAEVLAAARERFGPLHGVVHAAGVAGGGLAQLKSREAAEQVLAPKVRGTRVLEELLAGQPLDFLALCSGAASLLGGFGQIDYTAANAFLDAYAQWSSGRLGVPTVAINWDTWSEVGLAVTTEVPQELEEARRAGLRRGITPKEGVDAFVRVLSRRLPQVIVSTVDFERLLASSRELTAEILHRLGDEMAPRPQHPRPVLGTPFVAPADDLEEGIAGLLQQLLGIDRVGAEDDFFELGGNSLVATQLLSRVRRVFQAELTLHDVFSAPTARGIAGVLRAGQGPAPVDDLDRLVAEIESLSPERVEEELSLQEDVN